MDRNIYIYIYINIYIHIYIYKYCSSLYGIVTNELFMDSGFENKQNMVLVMTRKGIYMYISYI